MSSLKKKSLRRSRIRKGIRKKISGSVERPRLSVYRSNSEIYAQIIDDEQGVTLVAASSLQTEKAGKTPTEKAAEVGKLIAEKAKSANIEQVVFDRGGYMYHGRVKALAEGAREGGLIF
jgi:large subunit ribosomal protein L18